MWAADQLENCPWISVQAFDWHHCTDDSPLRSAAAERLQSTDPDIIVGADLVSAFNCGPLVVHKV